MTVHQVVAYNFRRAREEAGWTQSQTGEYLEPFLGARLNQAGISAIEKTFDSDRRRNIDVSELLAFARCCEKPGGWFLLPPPGHAHDLVEPRSAERPELDIDAADVVGLVLGSVDGWQSFLGRIAELLRVDTDPIWEVLHQAFGGAETAVWEKQIDLRRRAVQQVTLARLAGPEDRVVKAMAALLVELVKLTPDGNLHLRDTDPDEALALLAEGDTLVQPFIEDARYRRAGAMKSSSAFSEVEPIDLPRALGRKGPRG